MIQPNGTGVAGKTFTGTGGPATNIEGFALTTMSGGI